MDVTDEKNRPSLLVEGLIVHRTPSMRSLLFADQDALDSYLSTWNAAFLVVVPMFMAMVGGKLVLDDEPFIFLCAASISLGVVGAAALSTVGWWRTRGRVERLSWEQSVELDMRPIGWKLTIQAWALGALCLAGTAAILWFVDWQKLYWRKTEMWALAAFGVLLFTFCGGALWQMAFARMRYARIRRRLAPRLI